MRHKGRNEVKVVIYRQHFQHNPQVTLLFHYEETVQKQEVHFNSLLQPRLRKETVNRLTAYKRLEEKKLVHSLFNRRLLTVDMFSSKTPPVCIHLTFRIISSCL